MKTRSLMLFVLAMAFTAACSAPLPSLNPLWDESHQVAFPELAGLWISKDVSSTVRFAAAENGIYKVIYTSEGEVSLYETLPVLLGDMVFLDLYPDEKMLENRFSDKGYLPLIPTHFFAYTVLEGDSLNLAILVEEGVKERAERGELDIPLQIFDGGVLLTADTGSIQRFVEELAKNHNPWVSQNASGCSQGNKSDCIWATMVFTRAPITP